MQFDKLFPLVWLIFSLCGVRICAAHGDDEDCHGHPPEQAGNCNPESTEDLLSNMSYYVSYHSYADDVLLNKTCFTYKIEIQGTGDGVENIDHVVFGIDNCKEATVFEAQDIDVQEVESTVDLKSCVEGAKYGTSQQKGTTKTFLVCIGGEVTEGMVTIAIKGGDKFGMQAIEGPQCGCDEYECPKPSQVEGCTPQFDLKPLDELTYFVTFGGWHYDSVENRTCFEYMIKIEGNDNTVPDISHVVFGIEYCGEATVIVEEDNYEKHEECDVDRKTCFHGVKYDAQHYKPTAKNYTICVDGEVGVGLVTISMKGGQCYGFQYIEGPNCVCQSDQNTDTTTVAVKDTTTVAVKDTTTVAVKDTTTVAVKDTTTVAVKDTTTVAVKDTTTVTVDEKVDPDQCDDSCVDYHRHCDDLKAGEWLTIWEECQIPEGRELSCEEEYYAKRCPKLCGTCTQCVYITEGEVDNYEEEFCDNVTDALETLESMVDCVNELAPGSCESDEWHYFDGYCYRTGAGTMGGDIDVICNLSFPGSTGAYIFNQVQIDFLANLMLNEYALSEARLGATYDGAHYRNPDSKIIGTVWWNLSIPTSVGNCTTLKQEVGGFLVNPFACLDQIEWFCQKEAIPAVVL